MKKIISFILLSCMLLNITTAFAENNVNTTEDSNIINTDVLSDENVLYKSIQEKNGFSLFGLDNHDKNETTADFDVVMGFDMSYSMYEYDINGDKLWLDSFEAIEEQAPDNTRYAVLSSNTDGFTSDLETAINEVQNEDYTGTNDVTSMLDESLNIFDETSIDRNKVVIIAAHEVSDAGELEETLGMLRGYGVMPFVFVLNISTDNDLDIDGVYQCATDLDLRLALSDLYLAFSEFNMAAATIQTYTDNTGNSTSYVGLSDFRPTRHTFNGSNNSDGLKIASILNMYKCVPLKAGIGTQDSTDLNEEYDLFNLSSYADANINLENELRYFVHAENTEFGELPQDFKNVWDGIFADLADNDKIIAQSNITSIISKNMKRRFPVVIKYGTTWEIVYEYDSDIEENSTTLSYNEDKNISYSDIDAVFNTYEYLMSTVNSASNLYEKVSRTSSAIIIEIQYPSDYNFEINDSNNENNTIRREALDGKTGYIDFNSTDKTLYVTAQCTGENTERNFVVGSLATFTDGIADVYGTNKVYYTRYYSDIDVSHWAHDYVFQATNLEIVSGTDENKFEPDKKVTLAQLFRMIFETAKISGIDIEGNTTDYWAYPYMLKAEELGLIEIENNLDEIKNIGDATVNRGQAAKYICQIFYDNRDKVNVPTLLYDNVDNIENYRSTMFKGLGIDNTTDAGKAVYKLYMSGVMNGYDSSNMGINDNLTRAQICTMLIKCLFDMDENLPIIEANVIGEEIEPETIDLNSDGVDLNDIMFDVYNHREYIIKIPEGDNNRYYIRTYGELLEEENVSLTVKKDNQLCGKYENGLDGHDAYYVEGAGEYRVIIIREGVPTVGLRVEKINAAQDVCFNQKTLDKNGNPNYYIFVDSPESLKWENMLSGTDKTKTISCFKSLAPGTYIVFSYHHKQRPAKDENGNVKEADLIACLGDENVLYYNGVFYGYQGVGEGKINRIGLTYAQRDGWSQFYKAEERFNSTDPSQIISKNITSDLKQGKNVWLTDINKMPDNIVISDNDDMGFMYLMMEFEVTGGTVNFATMAMADSSDFDNVFDLNQAKPTYDEATGMIKGKGEFGKVVESDVLEYYIDDTVAYDTKLTFKTDTIIPNNGNVTSSFITNASPLYYLCKDRVPISSSLGLAYDAYYSLDTGEEKYSGLFFDTYHSPKVNPYIIPEVVKVGPYAVAQKTTWETNEEFNNQWFNILANTNYDSYGDALSENLKKSAKDFENFLGETNMQGYGVTFKYNIVIHNLSDTERQFVYHAAINRRYRINCYSNGNLLPINSNAFDSDNHYEDDIYTIQMAPNETANIVIESTELAGASATCENWFRIQ